MKQGPSVFFDVQLVHDAVHEWRQDKRCGSDEEQAREKCIRRREEFPHVACDRINWPHAPENHGGIHESVDPWQATKIVVAQYADSQGSADKSSRHAHEQDDPPEEMMAGQKWIATVLKHALYRIACMASARSRGAA